MGADQLGWFYFDGQLRYKDGHGWTDRYKPIEGPGAKAPVSKATPSGDTDPGGSPSAGPRRRKSQLVPAVCAGLLGIGIGLGIGLGMSGGLLKPDARKPASVPRDVNAFARGGPSPATIPASYGHPSHSDCLRLRDQVRAWSAFQNAHRPTGFSTDLPSSGDVQYLHMACGLGY